MKRGPGVGGVAVALVVLLPSGCGLLDPCSGIEAVSGIQVLTFGEVAEGAVMRVCIEGTCAEDPVGADADAVIVEHPRVDTDAPLDAEITVLRDRTVVIPTWRESVTPLKLELDAPGCSENVRFLGVAAIPATAAG